MVDFEYEIRRLEIMEQWSKEGLTSLRELALALGRETIFSPADVVRAARALSDHSVPEERILSDKLKKTLQFSVHKGISLSQSSDVVGLLE